MHASVFSENIYWTALLQHINTTSGQKLHGVPLRFNPFADSLSVSLRLHKTLFFHIQLLNQKCLCCISNIVIPGPMVPRQGLVSASPYVMFHSNLPRWRGAGVHGRGVLLLLWIRPRFRAFPRRCRRRGPFPPSWRWRGCRPDGAPASRHPATHTGHKKHPWAMVWVAPSCFCLFCIDLIFSQTSWFMDLCHVSSVFCLELHGYCWCNLISVYFFLSPNPTEKQN